MKPPTMAATDARDLRIASRELAEATEMLRLAYAVTSQRDRREALKVAIGRLGLVQRQIGEIIDRRSDPPRKARVMTCDESVADENGDFPPLAE